MGHLKTLPLKNNLMKMKAVQYLSGFRLMSYLVQKISGDHLLSSFFKYNKMRNVNLSFQMGWCFCMLEKCKTLFIISQPYL